MKKAEDCLPVYEKQKCSNGTYYSEIFKGVEFATALDVFTAETLRIPSAYAESKKMITLDGQVVSSPTLFAQFLEEKQ